jgi:hypothetical protein
VVCTAAKINVMKKLFFILSLLIASGAANSQYNQSAGYNAPVKMVDRAIVNPTTGDTEFVKVAEQEEAARDTHGNAAGSSYDLAVDGAFEGQTIVVLHLYTGEGFDFSLPKAALAQKGFSVYRYLNVPPSADTLKEVLKKACQLWVISDQHQKLTQAHADVIRDFFNAGHGVYIWGDNLPYYADANFLARQLIDVGMTGNTMGDQTVGVKRENNTSGILVNHLLTTGLEYIYEGITIATIDENKSLTPLIWGSAGNIVASVYEKEGRRLILDGGFTRLYVKWDTAGTGRYVKNAAAWLVNYEKFGDEVLGDNIKKSK